MGKAISNPPLKSCLFIYYSSTQLDDEGRRAQALLLFLIMILWTMPVRLNYFQITVQSSNTGSRRSFVDLNLYTCQRPVGRVEDESRGFTLKHCLVHRKSVMLQVPIYANPFGLESSSASILFPPSVAVVEVSSSCLRKKVGSLIRFHMASSLSVPTTAPVLRQGWCHGPALPMRRSAAATTRCAALRRNTSGGRGQYGGALVDEGMSVLRRRIREARMAETNYEAPAEWAAWEKRYYPAYVSDVSGLVGALQLMLMSTRPSVAIAVAALVLGSVPVSAVAALHHLAQVAESVLQSVHHVP